MAKVKVFISQAIYKEKPDGDIVLIGSECAKCGHRAYPATTFCGKCLSKEQNEYELEKQGEIYSYTITRVQPPYGHYPVPHPIARISIPESRARVTAPLFMEDEPDFKVGAKVKMEIAEYWEEDDKIVIGPKFRIIKEAE